MGILPPFAIVMVFQSKWKRGIRYEVVLNMTILSLFAILLSAIVIFKLLERHLILQEIENAKYYCNAVKEELQFLIRRDSLLPKSDARISSVLDQFARLERVSRLSVVDVRGAILANIEHAGFHLNEEMEATFRSQTIQSMVSRELGIYIETPIGFFFRRIPRVSIFVPLEVEHRVWGGLTLTLDLQGLSGLSDSAYRYFLVYLFLVSGVMAAFGSVLMANLIVQPLLALVTGTRKLSAGDLSTHVDIQAQNELGELAKAFNEMGMRLKAMIEEREVNLEKLAETNEKLRTAQDELVRKEKLATVGRLAAGVAHEIGNPIGAILGYAEILKNGVSSADQAQDFHQRIAQEASRIDRIIRDLLGISRPTKDLRESVEVNAVVEQTVNLMTGQDLFKEIQFSVQLAPENPRILGDFHMLQQILINLLTNGANALLGKGTLILQVKAGTLNNYKHIPVHAGSVKEARADDTPVVVLSIRDTGPGIDPDILGQIFEPFYTTMEPGKGTGLGLYMVANLLESMNATIGVESTRSSGAAFTLIFTWER